MEIWRPMLEAEGYLVSDKGRVMNVKFGFVLKPNQTPENYLFYTLRDHNKINHRYYIHKLIGKYFIPNPDNLPLIDHLDGDTFNNNISNLRWASASDNNQNQKKRGGTSQYKGVSWDKHRAKWFSTIYKDNKRYRLGRFNTEEDAALAYDAKAKLLYGNHARLNFP